MLMLVKTHRESAGVSDVRSHYTHAQEEAIQRTPALMQTCVLLPDDGERDEEAALLNKRRALQH